MILLSQIFSMNQFRLFSSKRHIDNLWFCLGLLWSLKAIFTLNAFTRANGSRDKSSLCAPIKKVIQALNYTRREFCLFFLKSCPHPQDIHIQSVLTAEEVRLKHTHTDIHWGILILKHQSGATTTQCIRFSVLLQRPRQRTWFIA